jgi:hypothetical protein
VSADTIVPGAGEPQAFNRYAFVFNNPLKYIDPSGHDPHYCETAECEKRYLDTLSRIQRKQEWWRQLLQSAEDAIRNWLMPIAGGPAIAPQPVAAPLQANATATPAGSLQSQSQATPQATVTATPAASPPPRNTVTVYRGIREQDFRKLFSLGNERRDMLSNVKSTDYLNFRAMSVFETPSPTHPYNLPFVVSYEGDKIAGKTVGTVSGVLSNGQAYEIGGGLAFYDNNPPGHWTIGFGSMDLNVAKDLIIDYAKAYYGP